MHLLNYYIEAAFTEYSIFIVVTNNNGEFEYIADTFIELCNN